MNRLALGTVQFGLAYGVANFSGQVSRVEAAAMLALAKTSGVDTLDTAVNYGESEACLGSLGVEDFRIVTKLPEAPAGCGNLTAWARSELAASLIKLGVPRVHGLLLHRPAQLLGARGPELYRALQALKDDGRVEKVGISIYAPEELDAIAAANPVDIVQAPFNLVDRRLEISGWLARLKDRGVEVHTRSAFLQGLLLMQEQARPEKFARWRALWTRWGDWLAQTGSQPVRACLAFVLAHTEVDRVLVGAENSDQLTEILAAAQSPLTDLPDLRCDDEDLVNPSKWNQL